MTDKEVGDWFRLVQPGQEFIHLNPFIMPLISKLIETRSCWLRASNVGYFSENALIVTLQQYNISENEWNNRVSEKP